MSVEQLLEFVDARGATLDQEKGILTGVKILGFESSNRRSYPRNVVEKAMPLYEGAKVNINHSSRPSESRLYEERFGALHNVRMAGDGLYGDLHYNPKHAVAEQFAWDVKNAPHNAGFSHVVEARTSRATGGKTVVESIDRVKSVDLVADPATTNGLFESHTETESETVSLKEATIEQLKAENPQLVEQITESILSEQKNGEAAKAREAELKRLKEENDAYKVKEEARAAAADVDALLKEHKLPEFAVTDLFRSQLIEADGKDARVKLIEDRLALIGEAKKPGSQKPKSREQNAEHVEESAKPRKSVDDFVSAITR